ncbi:MAG: hypothetical protein WBW99_01395, partial [Pseudolabrys sp.]
RRPFRPRGRIYVREPTEAAIEWICISQNFNDRRAALLLMSVVSCSRSLFPHRHSVHLGGPLSAAEGYRDALSTGDAKDGRDHSSTMP